MPGIKGIIEGDPRDFERAVDKAVKAINRLAKSADKAEKQPISRLNQAISGVVTVATKAASAVGTVLRKAFEIATKAIVAFGAAVGTATAATILLARRGAKVSQIETSFDRLSSSAGVTRNLIDRLQTATDGLISRTDLFASSNRLLAAKLPVTGGRFERLAKAAVQLGRALGFSATEAVQRLTLGLSKQEPELLDEIGLKVDLTKALQDEAKARGVTMQSLDAQTRLLVFFNAVEAQAIERSKTLVGTQNAVGDALLKIGVAFRNVVDVISKFVAQSPALEALFNAISAGIDRVRVFLSENAMVIREALDVIFQGVLQMGRAFVDQLGLSGEGFLDFTHSIVENRDSIVGTFERIGEQIGKFVNAVLDWFDQLGGIPGKFNVVVDLIAGALSVMGSALEAAAKPIAGLVTGFQNLVEFGRVVVTSLRAMFDVVLFVVNQVDQVITAMVLSTVQKLSNLNNAFRKIPGLDSFGAVVAGALSEADAALLRHQLGTERRLSNLAETYRSKFAQIQAIVARIGQSGAQFDAIANSISGVGSGLQGTGSGVQQIQTPGFQTGGPVRRTGLARVEAGEFVLSADSVKALGPMLVSAMNQARAGETNLDITVNGATGLDVRGLARLIAPELQRFARRQRGGGR